MKAIKPVRKIAYNEKGDFYNPFREGDGKLVCCCGFELIKEADNTYRCTGGHHRYNFQEGQVTIDKFGNVLLRTPEEDNNEEKNENSKTKNKK